MARRCRDAVILCRLDIAACASPLSVWLSQAGGITRINSLTWQATLDVISDRLTE